MKHLLVILLSLFAQRFTNFLPPCQAIVQGSGVCFEPALPGSYYCENHKDLPAGPIGNCIKNLCPNTSYHCICPFPAQGGSWYCTYHQ